MNEYMAVIRFPHPFDEEFASHIPAQRAMVQDLMSRGTVTSYSLSADRRTLWITLLAGSAGEAERTLAAMPLYRYMEYSVQELLFHRAAVMARPRFSMN